MFDISALNKRYFEIKLNTIDDEEKEHSIKLEVEPPKIKVLKKLFGIFKEANQIESRDKQGQNDNNDIDQDIQIFDDLSEIVRKILSKNKTHTKIPTEYIEELDLDQLLEITNAYIDWVSETRENSPN